MRGDFDQGDDAEWFRIAGVGKRGRDRMRRLFIALTLIVFMAGAVNAEGMMFGFKGGLNLANHTGDDADLFEVGNDMKLAYGLGVWFNYSINEAFSIQPEAMFMTKGTKFEEGGEELNFNLSYIDFNVLGKYAIPMEGSFSPFFAIGPQLGFLMKGEFEVDGDTEDMKDYMKSMEFGLVFGAGFDYMMEAGCITFDARYVLGLTSIWDLSDDELEGEDQLDAKNTGIQFLVGYGFAF